MEIILFIYQNSKFPVFSSSLFSHRKLKKSADFLKEFCVCQYYDEKTEFQERPEGRGSELGAPSSSTPLNQRSTPLYPPVRRKFHYKFKDGSSFLLYLDEFIGKVGKVCLQLSS